MKNSKNSILIISHSNYLIHSGGVEKFIRDYCEILKSQNINYIHVFPTANINKKTRLINRGYIGISYNGEFQGIWNEKNISLAIESITKKYSLELFNVQLHQFRGWNIKILIEAFNMLNIPIYVIAHDLEMISPSIFSINALAECKSLAPIAGSDICKKCPFYEVDLKRHNEVLLFFQSLQGMIKGIYVPSENTRKHFLNAFPQFSKITRVRSHVVYRLEHSKLKIIKPIRIAYIGSIQEHKGYLEWKKILDALFGTFYSFFYFGTAEINDDRVTSIKVDTRDKSLKSMTEQLRENNINLVFLWSKCPETFCYTYYEAAEAGMYILTSRNSGNIADQVRINGNGVVFDTFEDCERFLSDEWKVYQTLEYFAEHNCIPCDVKNNKQLIGNEDSMRIDKVQKRMQMKSFFFITKKRRLLSMVYKIMRK